MRLQLINLVRDVDPPTSINGKVRAVLKSRAQVSGNYRCPHCPHPDGRTFGGQCPCYMRGT